MKREYDDNNITLGKNYSKASKASIPEEKRLDRIKKNNLQAKRKNLLVALTVLLVVVIVGGFLCYTKLFKVQKLVIIGDCPYNEQEMLNGMGITIGDTLYGKKNVEIKQNVKYNLAYIDNIEISRVWPDTIKVKVEQANPTFYVSVENTMYVLSQSLRVLSKTDDIEDIELKKLVAVEIKDIKSCVEGEFIKADSDSEEILRQLYELLNKYEIFEEITNIDVTDRFNVTMMYGTKYMIKLGDKINLESKIKFMVTILEQKQKDRESGIIDVSDDEVKEATFESFT